MHSEGPKISWWTQRLAENRLFGWVMTGGISILLAVSGWGVTTVIRQNTRISMVEATLSTTLDLTAKLGAIENRSVDNRIFLGREISDLRQEITRLGAQLASEKRRVERIDKILDRHSVEHREIVGLFRARQWFEFPGTKPVP